MGNFSNIIVFPEPSVNSYILPNKEQQLLALSTIYNRFRFFLPYLNYIFTEKQYSKYLKIFIRKVLNCSTLLEYNLIFLEFCSRLNDCHSQANSFILESYFGLNSPPIKARFIADNFIISEIIFAPDIDSIFFQRGDRIIEIDNISIDQFIRDKKQYLPMTNHTSYYRDLANLLVRTNRPVMNYKIIREGKIQNIRARTYNINSVLKKQDILDSVAALNLLSDSVLYINLKSADFSKFEKILTMTPGLDWIIFDLRSSTQWILPIIEKHLFKDRTIFALYSIPLIQTPPLYSEFKPIEIGNNNKTDSKIIIKPIILVNENTQSQGEFQAMALQALPGAITIGSQTAGTDGNISSFKIPGNITINMTTMQILYPDRTETRRQGIKIDYYSRPTINDIIEGRDTELDLALQIINGNTPKKRKPVSTPRGSAGSW